MRPVEELVARLREQGRRITPQRRAILELLANDTSHPSAEEIYEHVPDISRMTVYNTLRELVAAGEILEVEPTLERGARYDIDTSMHHHLSCLRCHAIIDLHQPIDGLDIPLPDAAGYRIVRRQVTFYGYCPACQGQGAD